MSRYSIRHLPVVENGLPVAMVSDRDLSIAEAAYRETKTTPAAHAAALLGHSNVRRVPLDAPVSEVLHEMSRDRLDAVVVVHEKRIAGIFTATDACRVLALELGGGSTVPFAEE
jgi:CBS domain-containing protein